jgi:hypothetical protein
MRFDRRRVISQLTAVVTLIGAIALLAPAVTAAAQQAGWQPGPGAVGDNTYDGYIDIPASGSTINGSAPLLVGGWMVDKTAQGWAGFDQVQVVKGQLGSGGTVLANGIVAQNRPDVGAALGNPGFSASGFSVTVNGGSLSAGPQTIFVYGHTPSKGWWYKSETVNASTGGGGGAAVPAPGTGGGGTPTLQVLAPLNEEKVCTQHGDYSIRGSAYDANAPAHTGQSVDRVEVWINGPRDKGSMLGDATINGQEWNLIFTPTHFPSTHANLYVYARSKFSGQETMVLRGFNIVDNC